MLQNMSDIHMDFFDPRFHQDQSIFLAALMFGIMLFGYLVQLSILKLLKRSPERAINKFILCQQAGILLYSLFWADGILNMFLYPMKDVIGSIGCYFLDFVEHYCVILLQSASFYNALFRYLCIGHHSFLLKRDLSPMGLAKRILVFQYTVPAVCFFIFRAFGTENPGNKRSLLICLGRYEQLFGFTFANNYCEGGPNPWGFTGLLCQVSYGFVAITSSNVIEIFFLLRSMQIISRQNRSIKDLLSPTAFNKRQGEDNVMFAVNIWQLLFETLLTLSFLVYLIGFSAQKDLFVAKIWLIGLMASFTILNSFYLLGDNLFYACVRKKGIGKALVKALLQNY